MKRRSWKAALDASFRPRQGGLFLLSISWLMYLIISSVTGIEVQGLLDLLPVLFLIAFWTAWGALELFIWVETSPWRNQIRLGTPANRGKILWSLFTLVLFGYTMTKAAFYRLPYTLAEERDFVHSITSTTRGDASLLAINAEEFYVLTEQTSPWRAVRVNPYFLQFMEQIETRDCDDLIQDLDRNHYQLVVVKEKSQWKHACMALILAHLETQYQQTTFQSAERGCNTMALLQSLGEKPLQTMANFNGPIWFRCLRDKQWRNPAVQLNSGTYHVFTFG